MADDLESPGVRRHRTGVVLGMAAAVVVSGAPMLLADGSGAGSQRASAQPAAGQPVAGLSVAGLPVVDPVEGAFPQVPSIDPGEEPPPASPPAGSVPPGVKGRPDLDGCPVAARRLLTALRASDLPAGLAGSADLTEVECRATYAVARAGSRSGKPAIVVFRYTATTDSWQVVSRSCTGVPRAVRPHLRRCTATR